MHTFHMDRGSIGQRLKMARVAAKMSRGVLGKAIHKAYTTVAAYESGYAKPSVVIMEKIAPLLNVRVPWLAFGTGKMRPDDSDDEPEGLDRDIMTQVLREIERAKRRERLPFTPEEMAQLALTVHDISRKQGGVQVVRAVLIRILKGEHTE